jgi:hypothetical protein
MLLHFVDTIMHPPPAPYAHTQSAVGVLKGNPGLLSTPELSFFKDYIESFGGTVPVSMHTTCWCV